MIRYSIFLVGFARSAGGRGADPRYGGSSPLSTTSARGGSGSSPASYASAREHYMYSRLSREDVDSGYPLILRPGKGVRVRDVEDNEYLDLMSSASRASFLGYGDERMAAAMQAQLQELHYAGTGPFVAETTIGSAERLADAAAGNLSTTVFSSSGSEANEVAIKLAKLYQREHGKPRAYKVVSRWNDYHGSVGLAQDASDWLGVRAPAEPGAPGFSRIPAPTCHRCPFGLSIRAAICAAPTSSPTTSSTRAQSWSLRSCSSRSPRRTASRCRLRATSSESRRSAAI